MKFLHAIILLVCPILSFGQTQMDKRFDATQARSISLAFKYPDLIRISTWDKNEVQIKGTVNINNGENNDAFKLDSEIQDGRLVISSEIENLDDLPKKITIKEEDGTIYTFNTDNWNDPEVQQFFSEHGRNHNYISQGVFKEIKLEIFVPKNLPLHVDAKYGIVEVKDFDAPLEVNAKYGGIDINIPVSSRRDLQARTKYGEIYTDLDADFDQNGDNVLDYNKWTIISTRLNGGGIRYDLESKYGNVYMRKQ